MVHEKNIESFYIKLCLSNKSPASNYPLLIFPCTSDVDSLCAMKVICHILELDSVRYVCYPVSSYKKIIEYAGPSLTSSVNNPVTILLINWGCHNDLKNILELGPVACVFVVDSHRPIHLRNLNHHNDNVIVLYTDDDEEQADLLYNFDVMPLAAASGFNSDDEMEEDKFDGDSEDDEDGDGGSEDMKKSRVSKDDEMNAFKVFRKLKKDYYKMGTFHVPPHYCLLYKLSRRMNRDLNELLWLACVALTDQFVHEWLTNERYQAGLMELEPHINVSGNETREPQKNTKYPVTDFLSSLHFAQSESQSGKRQINKSPHKFLVLSDVNKQLIFVTGFTSNTKVLLNRCRHSYEYEPKLMLLQQWNLFDSMLCWSYMATKLKTWSDDGAKKLMLLLAQMGCSLDESKQKFRYMSFEIKKKLKDMFDLFLPDYVLNDFYFRGFMLDGCSSKVSAADVVYGVSALLESSIESNGSNDPQQFVEAYDALSLRQFEKLELGMRRAIKIQRAILRQVSMAITGKGLLQSGEKFRGVKLVDSEDVKLLGYPLTLTKFGYFLMDILKEKVEKVKPLICVCYTQERVKVLIVEVCGKPMHGSVQENAFGMAFRKAPEETGAELFHVLFESSWIILDAAAVNDFMMKLTEKLS
ncbi:uncharacterized protein [Rutidosis leptorrhynchoides]|uniref:uncharacterized protein n=1 Tax=Rutidosis leptorrhynchoides TaxID=125765 RepID=UPI003A99BBF8